MCFYTFFNPVGQTYYEVFANFPFFAVKDHFYDFPEDVVRVFFDDVSQFRHFLLVLKGKTQPSTVINWYELRTVYKNPDDFSVVFVFQQGMLEQILYWDIAFMWEFFKNRENCFFKRGLSGITAKAPSKSSKDTSVYVPLQFRSDNIRRKGEISASSIDDGGFQLQLVGGDMSHFIKFRFVYFQYDFD